MSDSDSMRGRWYDLIGSEKFQRGLLEGDRLGGVQDGHVDGILFDGERVDTRRMWPRPPRHVLLLVGQTRGERPADATHPLGYGMEVYFWAFVVALMVFLVGGVLSLYEGVRQSFWLQGMLSGMPAAYFCIKAFSETDLTEDLKAFDVPTLILHGDDDQIVPIHASSMLSSKIVKNARFKVYKGGSHGMCTHRKTR